MQGASDFYVVLGLESRATDHDIARAYRSLLRQHHPDTAPSPSTRGEEGRERELLAEIMEAYAVLSDPARRNRYDRNRQTPTEPFPGPKLREPGPGSAAGGGMSLKISPLRWESPARRWL
ncbi:DnaJ domain-containing protein [Paeniglutamicibacter sp. NPDC091659]|uniref:DnaJ domain-containing protein n=1 Tax=Paeniglutamicibacter sp. NPDC091659 TaxID=3364389 RepID=UPI00380C801D